MKIQITHIVSKKSIQQLEKHFDETHPLEKIIHSDSKIRYQVQLRVPVHLKSHNGFVMSPLSIDLKKQGDFTRITFKASITKFVVFAVVAGFICPLPFVVVDYGWSTYSVGVIILFLLVYFYFMHQLQKRVNNLIIELAIQFRR